MFIPTARHLVLATVAAGAVSFATPSTAEAAPRGFGLGVIVGDPTGVTGGFGLGGNQRFTFGVGFGPFRGEGIVGHVDWQWMFPLTSMPRADLSLYAGVGPSFAFFRDNAWLGVRGPAGLSFHFKRVPMEVFVEVAGKLWIVQRSRFGIDAAAGFRYWF